jgi:hypothetical protein
MRILVLVLAWSVGIAPRASSQEASASSPGYLRSGKVGLGIDGITGSPDVILKYFFNNQLALQVVAGFAMDVRGGSAPPNTTKITGLTLRGGASLLFHLTQEQVSPYAGVEAVFQHDKPGGFFAVVPDPKNSVIASGVLGGEFFLNERFTFGIKQAVGAQIGLKRDVPPEETDIRIATSTHVTGRFYFN